MKTVTCDRPGQYMDVSVVVPVYNSEATLPELAAAVDRALLPCCRQFELVLVNDGSSDRSWEVIGKLTESHSWIRGIDLMRNYGQHNALLCGIRAARSNIIVTMDDDLQNPPEEIPKLLARLEEGYDVVYGVPRHERHGMVRDLASMVTKLVLSSAMGVEIARDVSPFRAFRTAMRQAFVNFDGPYVSIDVLLTWGTRRFGKVEVEHHARKAGSSGYTFGKLARQAMNMMTGFSTMPLRLASIVGLTFTVLGMGLLAYVVGRYLMYGSDVKGFSFLASQISIFSGAQLFALGIIGEYVARVHTRTLGRPAALVREVTQAHAKGANP
jgi:glycosyltransferase involved in cell wall biosynthesis